MSALKSILFIHNGRGLGGAPKALRCIIEACVKSGHSCFVACLECPDTNPYFRMAGANVIVVDSLPCYSNSTSRSYKVNSHSFRKEREFAAHYAHFWFDFISKHGPFSLVFINSMSLCDLIMPSQKAGCRVIQVVRETAQQGPSLDIMKRMFDGADAVLFISEYDRKLFSINSERAIVIPDAVDPNLYSCTSDERYTLRQKHGIGEDENVLIFTGGNHYIKGNELLLKSLCRVSGNKPIILLYAGYHRHRDNDGIKNMAKSLLCMLIRTHKCHHERIARYLSIIERKKCITVKFLGYRQDIHEYFKVSDLCMVPYVVPHQAMPIFEAGMAKIPCLVTDFPCYRDEVTDGNNGYLLPVSNPYAWARAIEELAGDPDKRRQMGLNNYRRAIARHDICLNTENLLLLIKGVMGESSLKKYKSVR